MIIAKIPKIIFSKFTFLFKLNFPSVLFGVYPWVFLRSIHWQFPVFLSQPFSFINNPICYIFLFHFLFHVIPITSPFFPFQSSLSGFFFDIHLCDFLCFLWLPYPFSFQLFCVTTFFFISTFYCNISCLFTSRTLSFILMLFDSLSLLWSFCHWLMFLFICFLSIITFDSVFLPLFIVMCLFLFDFNSSTVFNFIRHSIKLLICLPRCFSLLISVCLEFFGFTSLSWFICFFFRQF